MKVDLRKFAAALFLAACASFASASDGCADACPAPTCAAEPTCGEDYFQENFEEDCCCYCPLWKFRLGAIYFDRVTPGGPPIATSTNGGATLLSPSDFDFQPQLGFDVSARRQLGPCYSLDLRYFGVNHSADTATPNAGLISIGGVNVGGATAITSNYTSQLQSAEINLFRESQSWWSLSAGFRYLGLDDALRNGFSAGGPTLLSYDVSTDNDLYGFQLGGEARLYQCGRLSADGYAKGGVYYNDISRATGFFPAAGAPIFPSAAGDDQTSFVGDVGVTGVYQWSERIYLRSGYQVLWLTGVAEAASQGDAFAGSPINRNNVVFHGATASVELLW